MLLMLIAVNYSAAWIERLLTAHGFTSGSTSKEVCEEGAAWTSLDLQTSSIQILDSD